MQYVAHRLFAGNVPENSHAGIDFVLERDVFGVEVDVQLSKDNVPFLLHDKTLNRTSNTNGFMSKLSSHEIVRDVKLDDGLPPPSLFYLLQSFKGKSIKVYLELIDPKSWPIVRSCIDANGFDHANIIISSFHHSVLAKARDCGFRTMALFEFSPLDPKRFLLDLPVNEIGIGFDSISSELVDCAFGMGIDCFAWTVNGQDNIRRAEEFNLSGIFTDFY